MGGAPSGNKKVDCLRFGVREELGVQDWVAGEEGGNLRTETRQKGHWVQGQCPWGGGVKAERDPVSGGGIVGVREEVIVEEVRNFGPSPRTPRGRGRGTGSRRKGRVCRGGRVPGLPAGWVPWRVPGLGVGMSCGPGMGSGERLP